MVQVCLAGKEINDAFEFFLGTDGDLERVCILGEPLMDALHVRPKIRAHPVELIDETHAGHIIAVRVTPVRLALRLHARHAVKHHDGAIKHPQTSFHFHGKVNVARSVDEIQPVLIARI